MFNQKLKKQKLNFSFSFCKHHNVAYSVSNFTEIFVQTDNIKANDNTPKMKFFSFCFFFPFASGVLVSVSLCG